MRLRRRVFRAETVSEERRELASYEVVTRILCSKNQFSPMRQRPKPGAFDLTPHLELSGIHVTGLSDSAIWAIAVNTLGDRPGRTTIYARADVPVGEFLEQKLKAIRDDNPFERHTSITGWPVAKDANVQKENWKAICLALSESLAVKLVIPPVPIARS